MKKSLIPVLLIVAFFAGCTSKGGNSTTDTTSIQALPAPRVLVAGATTAMIMPAVVNPGPPQTAGSITLTSPQPANKIVIAVIFNAQANQSVKVTSSAGGPDIADFPDIHGNNFPQVVLGPGPGITYTITARANGNPGNPYTNVTPNGGPQVSDDDQTFTDNLGNSARVIVVDLGTATP